MDAVTEDEALARGDRRRFVFACLTGLVASVPGMFLVSTLVIGLRDTKGAAVDFAPQILVGYAAMAVFVFAARRALATRIALSPWLLAPFHAALFAVGALVASVANCLMEGATDWGDWCGKPLFWLLLLGTVPALLVGAVAALAHLWLERRGI